MIDLNHILDLRVFQMHKAGANPIYQRGIIPKPVEDQSERSHYLEIKSVLQFIKINQQWLVLMDLCFIMFDVIELFKQIFRIYLEFMQIST